jgi:D-lactate dehydrogenase
MLGFDLYGKTVGIVGTGRIGATVASILHGFGCRLLAFDTHPNPQCRQWGVHYVGLDELLAESRIITLHCPLTPATHHLINAEAIRKMQPGVMLVNTGRGGLIDTRAVIDGLKRGHIGQLALDVYEEEEELFFEDLSGKVLQDDVFARLLTFPNVVITGHQAFFTREALAQIAAVTLENLRMCARSEPCPNQVTAAHLVGPGGHPSRP